MTAAWEERSARLLGATGHTELWPEARRALEGAEWPAACDGGQLRLKKGAVGPGLSGWDGAKRGSDLLGRVERVASEVLLRTEFCYSRTRAPAPGD